MSLFILGMIAAACSPVQHRTVPAQPSAASSTVEVATSLPTPGETPAAQATLTVRVASQCIPIEDKPPDDLPLSGVWLRNEAIPYLEDIVTGADTRIPFEGGSLFSTHTGDVAISPDGKYVAYIDLYYDAVSKYRPEKRILRVVASSGHSLQMDYWKEDWQWIIGWRDKRDLALFTGNRDMIALNPFTGEWRKFAEPAWLIAMGYTGDKYRYDNYQAPLFGPQLNKIMISAENGGFDIRDLQSGDVLFHGSGWADYRRLDWSADASLLAIATGEHLEILVNDQPVTDFDLRQVVPAVDDEYTVKVSPDGQKVAFIGLRYSDPYADDQIFIYDRSHFTVSMLCADEYKILSRDVLVWSPDSRFVIGEIRDSPHDYWPYQEFDVLIDTQDMRAFKLVSGQFQHRLLWLAAP